MQTLLDLGHALAARRRQLRMKQSEVARLAGVNQSALSRFETGKIAEFGSRKLLAVLSVLGMELQFAEIGASGSLDELRRERGGGRS